MSNDALIIPFKSTFRMARSTIRSRSVKISKKYFLEFFGNLKINYKVNASHYDWCQNLHDELDQLFRQVNRVRADKNLHAIGGTRPNGGLVSVNVIQVCII